MKNEDALMRKTSKNINSAKTIRVYATPIFIEEKLVEYDSLISSSLFRKNAFAFENINQNDEANRKCLIYPVMELLPTQYSVISLWVCVVCMIVTLRCRSWTDLDEILVAETLIHTTNMD